MDRFKLKDMTGGWFVGDFLPAAHRVGAVEVGYKVHKAGEEWPVHYHKIATEINLLLYGRMTIMGQEMKQGDIFVIYPEEVADPEFHTECHLIVIKMPSVPGDKYEV